MKKISLSLLIAIIVCVMIVFLQDIGFSEEPPPPPPPPAGPGDGYLLKRSPEETCHACHKTDQNRTGSSPDWADAIKSHNANRFGKCNGNPDYDGTSEAECETAVPPGIWTPTTKWGANWGLSVGKYGEIVCTTCHTAHDTKNIYLIKEIITTPDGTDFEGRPGENSVSVDFRTTGSSGDGLMGDDTHAATTSSRICEVCHTYDATQTSGVNKHAYNMSSEGAKTHQGAGGCTSCHSHKGAFTGGGCDSCHGYPPVANTAAPPNGLVWVAPITGSTTAGAHDLHVNTKSYNCDSCHYNNTVESGKHITDPRYITLGFYMFSGSYQGGSYDGQTSPNYNKTTTTPATTVTKLGNKTCSLYCHGSTLDATTLPIWDGTISCGSCHTALQTDVSRGSHARHARSAPNRELACTVCHANYVATPTAHTINGSADWAYDTTTYSWLSGALYNGNPSGSKTPVPSASYNTCSNLYCHSSVQMDGGTGAPVYTSPQWGGTVGCGDCHKGRKTDATTMDTGSHTKHVQSYNYACSICHNNAGTGATKHADYNIDVAFTSLNPSGTYSQSPNTPGNGYGTCSTTYCHGAGVPQWGGTLVGDCTDCHGFPPVTNAHAAHIQDATLLTKEYGNTEVKSNAAYYAFGCGNCHPIDKTTYHANGTKDISLNPADGGTLKSLNDGAAKVKDGTSGSTTVCQKVYCHSSGQVTSVRTYTDTPAWNSSFSGNKCAGCHGDPPSYASDGAGAEGANSHYNAAGFMGKQGGHLVGIHFDSIYSGTTGLMAKGGGAGSGAAHGDPNTSTTMSCNICHAATVDWTTSNQFSTKSGAGTAFDCATCHDGSTAFINVAGTITDKSKHVNAQREVQFQATLGTLKSKAQLRDSSLPTGWTRNNGYKAAQNSYDSKAFSATYDPTPGEKSCTTTCHQDQNVQWGDTTATCYSCHKSL